MVFRKIGNMPAFGRGIYVGGSLEVGRIDSPNNDFTLERSLFGGSLFLRLERPWGRLCGLWSRHWQTGRSAYLMLGRPAGLVPLRRRWVPGSRAGRKLTASSVRERSRPS